MRSRLVYAALLVTLAASVPACGGSKSSGRRDSAVPASDSSPDRDAQSDVAVPDGPSPDGVVGPDAAAKETTPAERGRDTLPDAPVGADTAAKETTAADGDRDTALPDGPLVLDTHGEETVRDVASDVASDVGLIDTADAKNDASDSRRDDAVTSADGALAAFCTGAGTRSMVNGFTGAPAVRVSRIATDCCDGFQLELMSATYASPIFVVAMASGVSFVPVDVDLGNPPQGWSFRVSSDCETSSPSSCEEHYDSGFVGTFRTSRVEDSGAIDLGLCLHVEDVDGSHQMLRTFDIYIPHAVAN